MVKKIKIKRKIKHLAAVAVIFDNQKRILLTQRNQPKSKHSHGKWQFPGGTIEFGEHPQTTAIRETKEEVGIVIKLLSNQPFIHTHTFEKENIHAIVLAYPAIYVSGKLDISQDKHTGDARWYTQKDIDYTLCLPQTKEIIENSQKYLNT